MGNISLSHRILFHFPNQHFVSERRKNWDGRDPIASRAVESRIVNHLVRFSCQQSLATRHALQTGTLSAQMKTLLHGVAHTINGIFLNGPLFGTRVFKCPTSDVRVYSPRAQEPFFCTGGQKY